MRSDAYSRRRFLAGIGVASIGVAGCLASADQEPTGNHSITTHGTTERSPTPTSQPTSSPTSAPPTDADPAPQPLAEGPPWWTPRGTAFDSFDTFETDWSIGGGTAEVTTDSAFTFGQSLYLDSAGDNRIRVERRFPAPRDFSDAEFSMAVRLAETTKGLVQVGLVLIDTSGKKRTLSGSIQSEATDRWVRFDLGVRDDEEADMRFIETLRIDHWTGNDATKFYVDDIRTHPKPEKGYVMFTFDDKAQADSTVAFPALREYGYQGACFPPIQRVTSESTPSIQDYQDMRDHGWDIGGHALDHEDLSKHSRAEQRAIIEGNFRQLHEKGLAGETNHFRTPYSNYDSNSLDLMTESFDTAIIGSGSATGTNVHVTDHRTIGFRSGDDLESALADIDAAAKYRQLLGMTLHMGKIDGDHLRALVEHVRHHERAGRLRVITPSQLYDEFIRS